jgi:hypothetical protein
MRWALAKNRSWHGFRASARTMLVDELNLDPLAIEANLAHAVKDSNGRSYNRTQYLKQRFEHGAAMGRLFGQAGTRC